MDDRLLRYERARWGRGCVRVAGIDEAGRGPLAGPVVAAAVVLERAFAERELHRILEGVNDSKRLSAARREHFCDILFREPSVEIGVGQIEVEEIDRINILKATEAAMAQAVRRLSSVPDFVLVDGRPIEGMVCAFDAIVRGDSQCLSIAAASIVAKVVRDAHMRELDRAYPVYGFAEHKGYGTSRHIQSLFEYGPCPEHRRSFRPVREALEIRRRGGMID